MSRNFLCNKLPMMELEIALDRWDAAQAQSDHADFLFLPIVVGVTFAELGNLMGTVYADPRSWEGRLRPTRQQMKEWAALGRRLQHITCMRVDLVSAAGPCILKWSSSCNVAVYMVLGQHTPGRRAIKTSPGQDVHQTCHPQTC